MSSGPIYLSGNAVECGVVHEPSVYGSSTSTYTDATACPLPSQVKRNWYCFSCVTLNSSVPDVSLLPCQSTLAVQDVASVVAQVRVTYSLTLADAGVTVNEVI